MNIGLISTMLIAEEKEVLHAYRDHLGYLTIGVGRLIDERKGGGISRAESRMLLAHDIEAKGAAAAAYSWFSGLDDARQSVVLGMIFQMGAGGFAKFSATIRALAVGRYDVAADQMLASKWATQTPERARRMAGVMRTGGWPY